MSSRIEIQQENQSSRLIIDFLIYFKLFRGFSNRVLAQKIHYSENFLTNVRNGDKSGSEKLLHDLETFFLLDNLNQISQIDRKILELQQEKTVLQAATIEKFYAERAGRTATKGEAGNNPVSVRVALNDAAGKKASVEKSVNYAAEIVEIVAAANPRRLKKKLKT